MAPDRRERAESDRVVEPGVHLLRHDPRERKRTEDTPRVPGTQTGTCFMIRLNRSDVTIVANQRCTAAYV